MSGNSQPQQMAVNSFQFQHNGTNVFRPRRYFNRSRFFHSLTVTAGMYKSADTTNTLRNKADLIIGQYAIPKFFNASMAVESSVITAHDLFALYKNFKVGWFLQNWKEGANGYNLGSFWR